MPSFPAAAAPSHSGRIFATRLLGPAYNILVSTDKPRYQPGQTLHTRVLVLDKLNLRPAAGQTVRVQIQEPGGIWLADQTLALSDWGIASLDLPLDERAESGQYRVVASLGPVESSRTVTVEPYTLPRFAIDFATDAHLLRYPRNCAGQDHGHLLFWQGRGRGAGGGLRPTSGSTDRRHRSCWRPRSGVPRARLLL